MAPFTHWTLETVPVALTWLSVEEELGRQLSLEGPLLPGIPWAD